MERNPEFLGLSQPHEAQTRWTDYQHFRRSLTRSFEVDHCLHQHAERLQSLAKPHLIGESAIQIKPSETTHIFDPSSLVITQAPFKLKSRLVLRSTQVDLEQSLKWLLSKNGAQQTYSFKNLLGGLLPFTVKQTEELVPQLPESSHQ